jgi:hypothetical protein
MVLNLLTSNFIKLVLLSSLIFGHVTHIQPVLSPSIMATGVIKLPYSVKMREKGLHAVRTDFELEGHVAISPIALFP